MRFKKVFDPICCEWCWDVPLLLLMMMVVCLFVYLLVCFTYLFLLLLNKQTNKSPKFRFSKLKDFDPIVVSDAEMCHCYCWWWWWWWLFVCLFVYLFVCFTSKQTIKQTRVQNQIQKKTLTPLLHEWCWDVPLLLFMMMMVNCFFVYILVFFISKQTDNVSELKFSNSKRLWPHLLWVMLRCAIVIVDDDGCLFVCLSTCLLYLFVSFIIKQTNKQESKI